MARYIVWFDALRKEDVRLAGAKGANLAEMWRAELPVPRGFVVTTEAFTAALVHNGLDDHFARRLALLADVEPDLVSLSRDLREKLSSLELPRELSSSLQEAYAAFGANKPVAVRASAPFDRTYSAIHESFTDAVGAADVLDRVRACWSSAFSPQALSWRRAEGLQGEATIAVVIEEMVSSKRSGLMLTSDPASGEPECVVLEAAFGVGSPVVRGLVEADRFVVSKSGPRLIESRVALQRYKVLRTPDGCEHHVTLPDIEACARALTDAEALELARLGLKAEALFGAPLEIEWAEDSGRWYLLQARTLPPPAGDRPGALLTGLAASPGVAEGTVRIIRGEADLERLGPDDILVARIVTPSWLVAVQRAAAVIVDSGGSSAWAAATCRELQLPCVMATRDGTRVLREGERVRVDGAAGCVFAAPLTSGRANA